MILLLALVFYITTFLNARFQPPTPSANADTLAISSGGKYQTRR
jgi:hypothetical protein